MHIVVVAAVIEDDGRFLLTLRPSGTHLAGHWEFPGGKCEPEETHAAALARELREELDLVDATVGEQVHSVTHAYPDRTVELHFFRVTIHGEPRPLLGQEMRWVPRADLAALPFPEADRDLVDQLTTPPAAGGP